VTRTVHPLAVGLAIAALGLGCGGRAPNPPPSPAPTALDPAGLATCEAAFRVWVGLAAAINDPDTDVLDNVLAGEGVERRVFELCSLADAERLNHDVPVEYVPGQPEPMIQPDFRTFAEVECVDESPLLDGTPLCAEVGH
jgi:hypothetical protein